MPSPSPDLSSPTERPSTPRALEMHVPPPRVDQSHTKLLAASAAVTGFCSTIDSSMTPPPSSQRQQARSITSDTSLPSSPPATVSSGIKKECTGIPLVRPTAAQLHSATTHELIEMLNKLWDDHTKLQAAFSETRMSAAHYKLQLNLLMIETQEAMKRMEVENYMSSREAELLRQKPQDSIQSEYSIRLKEYCKLLDYENMMSGHRLKKAKQVIEDQKGTLLAAQEEVALLHDRIRQNRQHINDMRSHGGPLHHISSPNVAPATPQYRRTPHYTHTPNIHRPTGYGSEPRGNQDQFNALLLAGSILNQENNSAPSTPAPGRHRLPSTPNHLHRGVKPLSSQPVTPGSVRPQTSNTALLPSAQFPREAEAGMQLHSQTHAQGQLAQLHAQPRPREGKRRRKSRDSTISASDAEEIARYRSEKIQESEASQSATEILRTDPRERFEVIESRGVTPVEKMKDPRQLQQTKICASVSKRKREDGQYDTDQEGKKVHGADGVGLGIGFEAQRVLGGF